jgi:xylulokinase
MALYLGLDSSTQSVTAIVIEVDGPRREVVFHHSLAFDEALPAYGTRHGVSPDPDPLVATAPPAMWAEALDRMMGVLREAGLDLSRLRAIAGSAQQHGSVYLARGAGDRLARLDPDRPLADQLDGLFSRAASPIWMDSSTAEDCAAITAAVGGGQALGRLTGSRAFERFTGPQIRKFARTEPEAYARTERIHLVSSFLASLLAGRHVPLEPGDASGMNLMDIASGRWAPDAVAATAEGLSDKLPPIAASWSVHGTLAPYWTRRYGLPPAKVVAWSGDNPCSLIGVGLIREGTVAVSLGTSDTVFGFMAQARVDASGTGHVFGSPTGHYMGLTCFKNGSLARERIRAQFGLDWDGFSDALARTAPASAGIMLPWFEAEITPTVLSPGVRRYGLDASDAAANVRAAIEGQMLAMARHSRWMGVQVDTIHATGGAAVNRAVLQVMADVFGAEVYQLEAGNSAALGAALRAYHADLVDRGEPASWPEVVSGFVAPVTASRVAPRAGASARYAALAAVHEACERHALGEGPDPADAVARLRARDA